MAANYTSSDDVTKYLVSSWCILTVLLSLLGNIFVLVASVRDKAIRLDRVSIVLIENLAVADIGFSVFLLLPTTVLRFKYNDFLPDHPLYEIASVIGTACYGMNSWLIPWLNCCKLFSLLFPLRVRNYRYRDGYKISVTAWILQTAMVSGYTIGWSDSHVMRTVFSASLSVLLLLAVFSTVALLLTVHKARGLTRQGTFSVILVSVLYLVSYIPLWLTQLIDPMKQNHLLGRITGGISFISRFSNPVVYYLTLQSFKDYVRRIFSRYEH